MLTKFILHVGGRSMSPHMTDNVNEKFSIWTKNHNKEPQQTKKKNKQNILIQYHLAIYFTLESLF